MATEAEREGEEKPKAGKRFTVYAPKGKQVKVHCLGMTVKFTTQRGKTAIEFEEGIAIPPTKS